MRVGDIFVKYGVEGELRQFQIRLTDHDILLRVKHHDQKQI